jgi:hypothetical protein
MHARVVDTSLCIDMKTIPKRSAITFAPSIMVFDIAHAAELLVMTLSVSRG